MTDHLMHVKIIGEPFLSRARAYRDQLSACSKAWWAFAEQRGASAVPGGLNGLLFNGSAPEGWTRPKGKHRWSCPKPGHPDAAIIAALPKKPNPRAVFGDAVIENLNYEGPDGHGGGSIGYLWDGVSLGWAGDTFFALIPDAKRAADVHLAEHPDHKITSGADKWTVPVGVVRISEAELDLIIAEYQVAQERAAHAEAAE